MNNAMKMRLTFGNIQFSLYRKSLCVGLTLVHFFSMYGEYTLSGPDNKIETANSFP